MEPVYRSVIGIARVVFAAQGLNFEVEGERNIPASGGAVIAVNHTGYLDFTYAGLPPRTVKRYIRFMAKKEVFDNKISGPIMRSLKHIPVDRGAGAESYKAAVEDLRKGELVGVYPEATISRSFEIKEFKSGAARMAIEAGVPVIPMVIWGAQRVWTKGFPKRLGRTKTPIRIAVGAPIDPVGPPNELTDTLHSTMKEMLLKLQDGYPHEKGAYWVPARLGGSAPTLEEADKLDSADVAARTAAREAKKNSST